MKRSICMFMVCFALIITVDYVFADFTPEGNSVPTSIGDITIIIEDLETGTDRVHYAVVVKDADGNLFREKTGNLVPHMTPAQITMMQTFVDAIRTKAQVLIP